MTNSITNKVNKIVIMAAKTDTGAGTAHRLPRNSTLQISGITTGTVTLEGSNDGVNYFTLSTDTSDNLRQLDTPVVWTRANVTVDTSVSVTVTAGVEAD